MVEQYVPYLPRARGHRIHLFFANNPHSDHLMLVNTLSGNDYSGGHVLQWWPGKDDSFALKFPVAASGKYNFIVRYTIRQDHGQGIVQLSVDGKPLGPQQLLYGPKDILGPPVDLSIVNLTSGQHDFGITYVQRRQACCQARRPISGWTTSSSLQSPSNYLYGAGIRLR